jgi:hypothetical protein
LNLLIALLIEYPLNTGTICVTPSPESTTRPVVLLLPYKAKTACIETYAPLTLNFSNNNSNINNLEALIDMDKAENILRKSQKNFNKNYDYTDRSPEINKKKLTSENNELLNSLDLQLFYGDQNNKINKQNNKTKEYPNPNIENSLNFDWNAMIKDENHKLIDKKHYDTTESFLEIEKKCMNDAEYQSKSDLNRLDEKFTPKRFPLKPINKLPMKVNDINQTEIKINKNIKINKHKNI